MTTRYVPRINEYENKIDIYLNLNCALKIASVTKTAIWWSWLFRLESVGQLEYSQNGSNGS